MVVRYRNTFWDIVRYAAYTYTHTPALLWLYAAMSAMVLYVAYALTGTVEFWTVRILMTVILFVLMVGTIFVVTAIFVVLSMISGANRTILTEHTITISDGGLVEETAFNRTEQKWTGIPRLICTRDYIFAYVSQYAAHVIPSRAFANAQEFQDFFQELQSRVANNAVIA